MSVHIALSLRAHPMHLSYVRPESSPSCDDGSRRADDDMLAHQQVKSLAHLVLRDIPLRRALYDIPHIPRNVPRVRRIPQLDQQGAGTCWMFAGMGFVSAMLSTSEVTPLCGEGGGASSEPPRAGAGDSRPHIFIDMAQLYRSHMHCLIRASVSRYRSALERTHPEEGWLRYWADQGIADGGTWGMFCHVADTEGIPLMKYATDEWPYHAQQPNQMLAYMSAQMRRGATVDEMLDVVDRCLGPSPRHADENRLTFKPKLADRTVQLLHAPDRACYVWYSSPHTNDASSPAQDPAYNVSIEEFVAVCKSALRRSECIWASFAVDLTFDRARRFAGGPQSAVVPACPRSDKRERMRHRDVRPEHAMVVVGFDETPPRWRIVNSWGKRSRNKWYDQEFSAQDKGDEYHDVIVTDEWFRDNVFHAVVSKQACQECVRVKPLGDVRVLAHHDILATVMRGGTRGS